jgi:hypothetical protein
MIINEPKLQPDLIRKICNALQNGEYAIVSVDTGAEGYSMCDGPTQFSQTATSILKVVGYEVRLETTERKIR